MGRQSLLLVILLLLSPVVSAAMSAVDDASLRALATERQWHHLLHFRQHPYSFRYISQNDSPAFFLAADGSTDPLAELQADVSAFLATGQAADESAQCRFPARYAWLKNKLPAGTFEDQPCPEFEQWRDELNAHSLTLIFPASHINSPSSMYGHTLVRLDRADLASSKLLAYSVNFAANADPTDNELVFSYKGLTGGYPGVVSVMPYAAKTRQYQHMEYRDTWEYPLNYIPAEVDQFVRHIWELRETYFDYYFFDENCSYRLLTLLDAASERSDLAAAFPLKAVPVDTIRALYAEGRVDEAVYRPSAASEMEASAAQASAEEIRLARALVDSDDAVEELLAGRSAESQARILELAYSYARYLAVKKKQASPELRARTLSLLSARSRLPAGTSFLPPQVPAYRDDQGHGTSRLTLAAGYTDPSAYADLRWRIAYHDVLDPLPGFSPGAQIEMGDFHLRLSDAGDIRLQHLTLVSVLSLSHPTGFQNPVAWTVSAGLDRFVPADSEVFSYLNIGFGKALQVRVSPQNGSGRLFALGDITARADNQFTSGVQVAAGLRTGWLWQSSGRQERLQFRWQPAAWGDHTTRRELRFEEALNLTAASQLRLGLTRQWADFEAVNAWQLSYARYF